MIFILDKDVYLSNATVYTVIQYDGSIDNISKNKVKTIITTHLEAAWMTMSQQRPKPW